MYVGIRERMQNDVENWETVNFYIFDELYNPRWKDESFVVPF